MPYTVHRDDSSVGDNFPADLACFCPPSPSERVGALPEWIWRITPPGAPLVPILNVAHAPGPGCVPCIRLTIAADVRPAPWPSRVRDEQIAARVPVGLNRPPRAEARRRRAGHDRWGMEAAYFRDLLDDDEERVAERLDLAIDEDPLRGPRSRSARRYVTKGREILAGLGAWPWCLDERGQLEEDWWTTQRYAKALAAWHFNAFADGLDELVRPAQYAAGERPAWRVVDRDLATRLYRDLLSSQ